MIPKEKLTLIKKAMTQDTAAFTVLMQLYMKDMYKVALAILMNNCYDIRRKAARSLPLDESIYNQPAPEKVDNLELKEALSTKQISLMRKLPCGWMRNAG